MKQTAEPFPWKQAMSFGFGVLQLSPESFWSLSVLELQAAIEAHSGSAGASTNRTWLNEALHKYPDGQVSKLMKGGTNATE